MSDDEQPDLFDDYPHVHTGDPDTSEKAIPANLTAQCLRVLKVYIHSPVRGLLDHEAYKHAGFPPNFSARRCSDLRKAGMIERTGERGATPSGKSACLCRITEAGLRFLRRHELDRH